MWWQTFFDKKLTTYSDKRAYAGTMLLLKVLHSEKLIKFI